MKLLTNLSLLPCTCGNHFTGLAGDTCDLCMGYISSSEPQEEDETSSYDMAYFEALEAHSMGLEYAA